MENKNDRYNNTTYVNSWDKNSFVVVEKEISSYKVLMKGGQVWSKNRLGRYWEIAHPSKTERQIILSFLEWFYKHENNQDMIDVVDNYLKYLQFTN